MSESADSIAARQTVYKLMSQRFPSKAIDWVKLIRWDGPEKVDLADFDTDDEVSWAAYRSPAHVDREIQQYKDGENKPIIAVRPPGKDDKLIIIDGHHRFLARERMKKDKVQAYVGLVPAAEGPWQTTHLSQKGGDSG